MRVLTVLVISIPPSAQVPRVGDIEITKTVKTRIGPNTKTVAKRSKIDQTSTKLVQFDTKIAFPTLFTPFSFLVPNPKNICNVGNH